MEGSKVVHSENKKSERDSGNQIYTGREGRNLLYCLLFWDLIDF